MSEIERVNEDPEFREYISAEEEDRKIENSLRSQYRREGLAEGRTQGLEEGRAEGERLARLEDAKRMKKDGMSIDLICKYTELSHEDVEKL